MDITLCGSAVENQYVVPVHNNGFLPRHGVRANLFVNTFRRAWLNDSPALTGQLDVCDSFRLGPITVLPRLNVMLDIISLPRRKVPIVLREVLRGCGRQGAGSGNDSSSTRAKG